MIVVTVAALPVMLIGHVPDVPVPVSGAFPSNVVCRLVTSEIGCVCDAGAKSEVDERAAEPRPRFVRADVTLVRSDRLLAESRTPAPEI